MAVAWAAARDSSALNRGAFAPRDRRWSLTNVPNGVVPRRIVPCAASSPSPFCGKRGAGHDERHRPVSVRFQGEGPRQVEQGDIAGSQRRLAIAGSYDGMPVHAHLDGDVIDAHPGDQSLRALDAQFGGGV